MKKFLTLFFIILFAPMVAFAAADPSAAPPATSDTLPPENISPVRDTSRPNIWDISNYASFDYGIGNVKSERAFSDLDQKFDTIGGGMRGALGYKLPFLRAGVEFGGNWAQQKFTSKLDASQEDKYRFSAFYVIPQVFLELDWPGYVVPYVGYGVGAGLVNFGSNVSVLDSAWPQWARVTQRQRDSTIGINRMTAFMIGARFSLNSFLDWNLYWRQSDYGRIKITADGGRLVSREIATGLVARF